MLPRFRGAVVRAARAGRHDPEWPLRDTTHEHMGFFERYQHVAGFLTAAGIWISGIMAVAHKASASKDTDNE